MAVDLELAPRQDLPAGESLPLPERELKRDGDGAAAERADEAFPIPSALNESGGDAMRQDGTECRLGGRGRAARRVGLAFAIAMFALAASAASALAATPVPGSFTGDVPLRHGGLTFYVSSDATQVQDFTIPIDDLKCTGEGTPTLTDHLEAFEVKIESGAFSRTAIEKGRLEGYAVTFTFAVSGTFASNGEEASGTYSEKIAFEGSARACTTSTQPFSAKRDTQPTQTTAAPPAGSYTGNIPTRQGGLDFFVSSSGSHVQDVSIPTDDLRCTGEGTGTMTDHLEAPEITATLTAVGRTFKSAKTEKGAILEGQPVTIKFTFDGHFHSVNSEGVARAAGTYREDITFEGSTRRCTTDNQWFYATRDSQPTQTTVAPPAGSYVGNIPLRPGGLSFEVSSDSLHLLSVKIPTDELKCTGESPTTDTDKLEIAEIAISSKVAFKSTLTGKRTISGKPVSFVYTVLGHFHSVNASGKERAAGMYREELTFEGANRRCTTDNQSFSAAHT